MFTSSFPRSLWKGGKVWKRGIALAYKKVLPLNLSWREMFLFISLCLTYAKHCICDEPVAGTTLWPINFLILAELSSLQTEPRLPLVDILAHLWKKRNNHISPEMTGSECLPCRCRTVSVASPITSSSPILSDPVWARKPNVLAWAPQHSPPTCLFCSRSIRRKWSRHHEVFGLSTDFCHRWVQMSVWCCWPVRLCVPPLCQIKGQRLDGEATLLFLLA